MKKIACALLLCFVFAFSAFPVFAISQDGLSVLTFYDSVYFYVPQDLEKTSGDLVCNVVIQSSNSQGSIFWETLLPESAIFLKILDAWGYKVFPSASSVGQYSPSYMITGTDANSFFAWLQGENDLYAEVSSLVDAMRAMAVICFCEENVDVIGDVVASADYYFAFTSYGAEQLQKLKAYFDDFMTGLLDKPSDEHMPILVVPSVDVFLENPNSYVLSLFTGSDRSKFAYDHYSISSFTDFVADKDSPKLMGTVAFWYNLVNSFDVFSMTSWLPAVLSAPYIYVFGFFIAAVSVLVLLKVLRG